MPKRPPRQRSRPPRSIPPFIAQSWPVVIALAAYAYFVSILWFRQDDAYITFRYVANWLNGDGLVFNIGERVEGFTNFGWTVYLALSGALGLPYQEIAQITGLLCGAGVIILAWRIARLIWTEIGAWQVALVTLLVGSTQSLAYWSPAGLETAAFALMTTLSVYWYLTGSRWIVWSILMAVWIRPEGALVAGLLLIVDTIVHRRFPRRLASFIAIAFVLSLPFVAFKFGYYGSLLPNPFFAKTGSDLESFRGGLVYIGEFFSHYGFYGLPVVVTLFLWRSLTVAQRTIWLFSVIYTLYIVAVGGDVLKVHRFWLPLFGCFAILLVSALTPGIDRLRGRVHRLVVVAVGFIAIGLTIWLPYETVSSFNRIEKLFLVKQQFTAQQIRETARGQQLTVATPTIGIFGFELVGHTVIDMLGLTDSTIARHPQEPIPGLSSTWRERNLNTPYLLSRAPDYIVFSTGNKPSAPAERALFLYPDFLDRYRTVGWYYVAPHRRDRVGSIVPAFRKISEPEPPFERIYPIAWVEEYKRGLEAFVSRRHDEALSRFETARQIADGDPSPYLTYHYAQAIIGSDRERLREGITMLAELVAADTTIWEASRDLHRYLVLSGRAGQAAVYRRWLGAVMPWYLNRHDSLVSADLARARNRR